MARSMQSDAQQSKLLAGSEEHLKGKLSTLCSVCCLHLSLRAALLQGDLLALELCLHDCKALPP